MIKELVKKTRSYRSFKQEKVLEKDLLEMITVARMSGSTGNIQNIRYAVITDKEATDFIFANSKYAGLLKWNPTTEEAPTAYIIMYRDKSIELKDDLVAINMGIASQNIMLTASELGYGGCLVGAYNKPKIEEYLGLEEKYSSFLVIALGIPNEEVELSEVKNGQMKYYRENGIHYVPKLSLDELIILKK